MSAAALRLPGSHFKGFAAARDPNLRGMASRHSSSAISAARSQVPESTTERKAPPKTVGGGIMAGVGAAAAGAQIGTAMGAGAAGATQGSAGGWWGAGLGFVVGLAAYALS